MFRRLLAFAGLLLLLPTPESYAQFTITQYRVTRTAPGDAPNTFVFAKSQATCNVLASAIPTTGPLVSVSDEATTDRFCYLQAAGNWSNLTAGVRYTFTIAAAGADNLWSPESAPFIIGRPGAPTNFGLRPSFTGVVMNGTVLQRGPLAGLDVVTLQLDDNRAAGYVGLVTLSIPGFEVRPGDRGQLAFWR